jgi:hypothetical protein
VLAVVLPYKKSGRNVTYGNLTALPGERRIWRLRPQ